MENIEEIKEIYSEMLRVKDETISDKEKIIKELENTLAKLRRTLGEIEQLIKNSDTFEDAEEKKSKHVESYAKTTKWVFTGWMPREMAEKRIKACPKVVTRKEYTVLYHDDGSIERFKM